MFQSNLQLRLIPRGFIVERQAVAGLRTGPWQLLHLAALVALH